MKTLAEDWSAFTYKERTMMARALSWYARTYNKKEVPIGAMPFLDRKAVAKAVQKYMDNIALVADLENRDTAHWRKLENYLKFGPYVRRWKNG